MVGCLAVALVGDTEQSLLRSPRRELLISIELYMEMVLK